MIFGFHWPFRSICYSEFVNQIFLFTGEGTFVLREERRKWQDAFRQKHGAENLLHLDAAKLTYRALLDEVSVMPFLAEKRLVIVEGIPRFEKEEMEALPQHMHPSSLLVFSEPKPDKRLGSVKVLQKIATVKEFTAPAGAGLRQWIRQYAQSLGSSMDDRAAEALLHVSGDDQQMLSLEIQKLATAASGKPITVELVSSLAVRSGEQEIWHLSSLIAKGDAAGALTYVRSLAELGEDPYSLWNVLLWMIRMFVMVHASAMDGERNPAKVASAAEVPFPTARTLLPLAQSADPRRVAELVRWTTAADIHLKTGGYRVTSEAPQELFALIDECVWRCAGVGRK